LSDVRGITADFNQIEDEINGMCVGNLNLHVQKITQELHGKNSKAFLLIVLEKEAIKHLFYFNY
jgi:hypothetical protein